MMTTYGFVPRESGKTRSIGYSREVLPTMNADGNYAILAVDELTVAVNDSFTEQPKQCDCRRYRGLSYPSGGDGIRGGLRSNDS